MGDLYEQQRLVTIRINLMHLIQVIQPMEFLSHHGLWLNELDIIKDKDGRLAL